MPTLLALVVYGFGLSFLARYARDVRDRRHRRGPLRRGRRDFAIGVEEELILVDPASRALSHAGVDVLARMGEPEARAEAASRTPTPTRR